ncbi:hypothetical protein Mpt1_c05470 [Candidatus Methanoplasma termitum]|uniref:Uncharacterized protein n=1 Tax=Candidatus Methanoplasma termitum TaxID=1577791 RepID=A0A0A7LDN3_9ARCH|nr:hypothetical protein Mpt1_c05470 [Candidatus Methanoplasma termitum]
MSIPHKGYGSTPFKTISEAVYGIVIKLLRLLRNSFFVAVHCDDDHIIATIWFSSLSKFFLMNVNPQES